MDSVQVVEFDNSKHREQLASMWEEVFGYKNPWNRPGIAIDKKISVRDGLFFVAIDGEAVVGTVMAGYDGHRGWIYSLAVIASRRNRGIGRELLAWAERKLSALGCVKINLQIMRGNESVQTFYQGQGYATEPRISMGKCLNENFEEK